MDGGEYFPEYEIFYCIAKIQQNLLLDSDFSI